MGFEPTILGLKVRCLTRLGHHPVEPGRGIEPLTCGLQNHCYYQLSYPGMEEQEGFEPPEDACTFGGFQGHCDQPLCHCSVRFSQ